MDLTTFLKFNRLSLDSIRDAIESKVGLFDGEVLFLSGSLCEGLGNQRSDIDAFIFTDRDLSAMQTGPVIATSINGCPIDLEWKTFQEVDRLIPQMEFVVEASNSDPRNALNLSYSDIDLLHRIRVGEVLFGEKEFQRCRQRIRQRELSNVLFNRAVADIPALQSDIIGFLIEGDYRSTYLRCQDFLGLCIDVLLATLGNTNPGRKWRFRKLEEFERHNLIPSWLGTSSDGSISSQFFSLHCFTVDSVTSARKLAHDCIMLSNRIIPWCQSVFSAHFGCSMNPEILEPIRSGEDAVPFRSLAQRTSSTCRPLPSLSLDVQMRWNGSNIELFSLMGDREFLVNEIAYRLLLHFDGRSTTADAISDISRLSHCELDELANAVNEWENFLRLNRFLEDPNEQSELAILARMLK